MVQSIGLIKYNLNMNHYALNIKIHEIGHHVGSSVIAKKSEILYIFGICGTLAMNVINKTTQTVKNLSRIHFVSI